MPPPRPSPWAPSGHSCHQAGPGDSASSPGTGLCQAGCKVLVRGHQIQAKLARKPTCCCTGGCGASPGTGSGPVPVAVPACAGPGSCPALPRGLGGLLWDLGVAQSIKQWWVPPLHPPLPSDPSLAPAPAAEGAGRAGTDRLFLTQTPSLGGAECRGVWGQAALQAPPCPIQACPLSATSCHSPERLEALGHLWRRDVTEMPAGSSVLGLYLLSPVGSTGPGLCVLLDELSTLAGARARSCKKGEQHQKQKVEGGQEERGQVPFPSFSFTP